MNWELGIEKNKNRPGDRRLSSSTICSWIVDSDSGFGALTFPDLYLMQYGVAKHFRPQQFLGFLERVYAFDLGFCE
jgi:hypothetical protein